MTTIHVTVDDHAEALGVVATLLNQGYEVSIDLDLVPQRVEPDYMSDPDYMSTERVAIHSKLWGPKSEAAEALDTIERLSRTAKEVETFTIAGLRVTYNGKYYTANGRRLTKSELDEEVRMRLAARDERTMRMVESRVIACSACGAEPDMPCITKSGKRYNGNFAHYDRVRDWEISQYPVPARVQA